ncbi:hypothetical protein PFICI_01551 [Pestalotiopsis fici W106-1]|uniref:Uncharacterized protein n=1 Tax=Pestalotiopsis fici (strain W106-1 / CGMCC3.15140) TaxID=1229662 RepID=W3XNW0_PESFW|nr:uncharacterized protein PFICI_01551 [Pestalotiopsis fici W106-1]ETS87723.1 hypothetical protein PFICI_01551 [Pestalotiopsis fici W106-1]
MAAAAPPPSSRIDTPSPAVISPHINGVVLEGPAARANATANGGHGGASPAAMQPPRPPPLPHTQPALMRPGMVSPANTMSTPASHTFPESPQQQGPSLSPAFRDRTPSTHNGKIAIVEPPSQANSHRSSGGGEGGGASSGFPSPTREPQRVNPKFHEDLSRLTHAIQQSVPEAVRRVTRENWEKTLLGTDFHQAFVMNATIHQASGAAAKRAIKDFGGKMVASAKHEIIEHFTVKDLDEVADAILAKVSDGFLDKALEKRLATIDARSLINALARAERLGYENNDSMDETGAQGQVPNQQAQPQPNLTHLGPANPLAAHPVNQTHAPDLQCHLCWRKFKAVSAYDYHVKKKICTKEPPSSSTGFEFSCEHCGAGFITNVGQQYVSVTTKSPQLALTDKKHHANKVCGDHGMAAATPKPSPHVVTYNSNNKNIPAVTPVPVPMPQLNSSQPVPTRPNFSQPGPPPTHHQQHALSTPISQGQKRTYTPQSQGTPGPPSSTVELHLGDPYAHLTPQDRANLEEELRQAEELHAPRFKEAEAIEDPVVRAAKLDSVKNVFSTRQSLIRKRYGVRLRVRRSKAVLEAEKSRMAALADTPSAKRQRTDFVHAGTPLSNGTGQAMSLTPPASILPPLQPPALQPPRAATEPTSKVNIPETNNNTLGVDSSESIAATADSKPAAILPPTRSLSSMKRSGYRISTHTSRHSTSATCTPDPMELETRPNAASTDLGKSVSHSPMPQRGKSAAEPVLLDDDSSSTDTDSESDSDEDIPAQITSGPRAVDGSKAG